MAENIATANNSFSTKIFAEFLRTDGNVIISPWSLFNALAMTYVGARKNTALQMSAVLGFEDLKAEIRGSSAFVGSEAALENRIFESFENLLESLQKISSVKYATANRIWVQNGYDLCDEFRKALRESFQSESGRVDFVKATEAARCEINSWVEDKTNAKIKDLIASGILNNLTRLVLTSAVYFKGSWLHEFKKENTMTKAFNVSANKKVQVKMMYMNAKKDMGYYETDQFQVLAMPYLGDRLTMNVILPKDGLSLTEVLGAVKKDLDSCIRPAKLRGSIEILIPKFKLEFSSEFEKILCSLGANDMFSDRDADFSGITEEKPGLKVGSVVQKAFIEVNEEGTEAAAATAVIMVLRCAIQIPLVFNADHPFLFLICDKETKLIMFIGKVEDPSKEK